MKKGSIVLLSQNTLAAIGGRNPVELVAGMLGHDSDLDFLLYAARQRNVQDEVATPHIDAYAESLNSEHPKLPFFAIPVIEEVFTAKRLESQQQLVREAAAVKARAGPSPAEPLTDHRKRKNKVGRRRHQMRRH